MSNQVGTVNGVTPGVVSGDPVPGDTSRGGGRPTMKDVASRAGVALKTVSRVVNREPGVTPETTRRVLGAIEDLGFRRNESARLLRTGHTATLGYIADTWTDPDHAAVYRGLESIAREHGYLLYSGSTDSDPEREEQLALAMCARRVDGLIISPTPGSHDYLVSEIEAGVATVFVLRPPELVRARTRCCPTSAAARGPPSRTWPRSGTGGSGSSASPPGTARGRCGPGTRRRWRRPGWRPIPAWLTLDTAGLAARGRDRGVLRGPGADPGRAPRARPPRSVTVVGFGDFELADLLSPPVTVVSYDPELIGRTAGELLLRRLAGDAGDRPAGWQVPVRLIAR